MSHVAWSACLSVCVLGTRVNCAKTAELIGVPFEGQTFVSPGNHMLDDDPYLPREGSLLRGHVPAGQQIFRPIVTYLYA